MRGLLLGVLLLGACSTTKVVSVKPLDRFNQKEVLAGVEALSASNSLETVVMCSLVSRGVYNAYSGEKVGSSEFNEKVRLGGHAALWSCLLYTSPSPRDRTRSRMPSSA